MTAGVIGVALNDWFGSGDLKLFAIYSIPYAILSAPAVDLTARLTTPLPVWAACAGAFAAGVIFGLFAAGVSFGFHGGTVAVGIYPAPLLFGAISVPVMQAWCIGAAIIFPAAVLLQRTPLSGRANDTHFPY